MKSPFCQLTAILVFALGPTESALASPHAQLKCSHALQAGEQNEWDFLRSLVVSNLRFPQVDFVIVLDQVSNLLSRDLDLLSYRRSPSDENAEHLLTVANNAHTSNGVQGVSISKATIYNWYSTYAKISLIAANETLKVLIPRVREAGEAEKLSSPLFLQMRARSTLGFTMGHSDDASLNLYLQLETLTELERQRLLSFWDIVQDVIWDADIKLLSREYRSQLSSGEVSDNPRIDLLRTIRSALREQLLSEFPELGQPIHPDHFSEVFALRENEYAIRTNLITPEFIPGEVLGIDLLLHYIIRG